MQRSVAKALDIINTGPRDTKYRDQESKNSEDPKIGVLTAVLHSAIVTEIQVQCSKAERDVLKSSAWVLGSPVLDPKLLLQSLAHLHLEWPSSGHWVHSPRSNVYIYSGLKNFNSCTAVFLQLIIFTADYLHYTTQTIA